MQQPHSEASTLPIFDGHNDLLMSHQQDPARAFLHGPVVGQKGLPRRQQGSSAAGSFAPRIPFAGRAARTAPVIRVNRPYSVCRGSEPSPYREEALDFTLSTIVALMRIEPRSKGAARLGCTAANIRQSRQQGAIAMQEHIVRAGLARRVKALNKHGYERPLLEKICHANGIRVPEATRGE